jgi:hypothetical protein
VNVPLAAILAAVAAGYDPAVIPMDNLLDANDERMEADDARAAVVAPIQRAMNAPDRVDMEAAEGPPPLETDSEVSSHNTRQPTVRIS